MDKETRNAFAVIGGSTAVLLVIGYVFSGSSSDAIYSGPPVRAEQVAEADIELEPDAADEAAAEPEDEADPDLDQDDSDDAAAPEDDDDDGVEPADVAEAEAAEDEAAEDMAEAEDEAAEDVAAAEDEAVDEEAVAEDAPAEGVAEDEMALALAGDPAAGQSVFRQCQACHQVGDGAQNRVGPQLNNLIGREAGSVEGFRYSNAMQAAASDGLVWTVDNLTAYLENPRGFLQGTSMAFAGVRNATDLENLIAYLAEYQD